MIRPLPLILILLVALTGIGLGAARGTVRLDDRIVLCTGHGVVVIARPDASGTGDPALSGHLCPDMALSMLAALTPDPVALSPRAARLRHPAPGPRMATAPMARRQVRARDPPRAALARPA